MGVVWQHTAELYREPRSPRSPRHARPPRWRVLGAAAVLAIARAAGTLLGERLGPARRYDPTFRLVRTTPGVVDLGEGCAEVGGEGVGRGDEVVAGLDLDGSVAAGGLHESPD